MKKLSVLTKLSLCATITAALLVGCSSPSKTETTAAASETAKKPHRNPPEPIRRPIRSVLPRLRNTVPWITAVKVSLKALLKRALSKAKTLPWIIRTPRATRPMPV